MFQGSVSRQVRRELRFYQGWDARCEPRPGRQIHNVPLNRLHTGAGRTGIGCPYSDSPSAGTFSCPFQNSCDGDCVLPGASS